MPPNVESAEQNDEITLDTIFEDVQETLKQDALEPDDAQRMEDAFAAIEEMMAAIKDDHARGVVGEKLAEFRTVYRQKTKL
jgi:hypothetical protein